MYSKEAGIKGSKKRKENLEKELQIFIDDAIKEGYSGDYAVKIARENRKKIIKRLSPMTIEFWINRGLSKEEAKYKIKTQRKINKEYWISRGSSEEEAIKKVKDFQKEQSKKVKNFKSEMHKEYWIEHGFSEEEAKEKVKDRQATGKLEKYIVKYGEKDGRKKWEERQIKWQNTMNDKGIEEKHEMYKKIFDKINNKLPEEKKRINKLKGTTLENQIKKWGKVDGTEKYYLWYNKIINHLSHQLYYSKMSQELFYKLLENISDKENVKFATHNGEKIIRKESRSYLYDFCYNKKIIEFNGDYWHANPQLYKEIDILKFSTNLTAKEIWKLDEQKINVVKNKGYKILIIWEKDYKENKEKIINECLNFLL